MDTKIVTMSSPVVWPQHAAFVLVYLALLGWILAVSKTVAPYLRVLGSIAAIASALFHMISGIAEASDSVSLTLHDLWPTQPLLRVRMLRGSTIAVALAATAVHYVSQQRKFVMAKMVVVAGPLLASTFYCWWGWDRLEDNSQSVRTFGNLSFGVSLVFIVASTRSRVFIVFQFSAVILGTVAISAQVYCRDAGFGFGIWQVLAETVVATSQGATMHALSTDSRSQLSPRTPFAAIFARGQTAMFRWHLWPVVLSVIPGAVLLWTGPLLMTTDQHGPWHRRIRELLSKATTSAEDEGGSMLWLAVVGCTVCVVIIAVVHLSKVATGPGTETSNQAQNVRKKPLAAATTSRKRPRCAGDPVLGAFLSRLGLQKFSSPFAKERVCFEDLQWLDDVLAHVCMR